MLQQLLRIVGAAAEGEHLVRRHAFAIANALVSALVSLQDSGHEAQTRAILQVHSLFKQLSVSSLR